MEIAKSEQLLIKQYDYMIYHSPFYKKRLQHNEIPKSISKIKDIEKLPFTEKQDLRDLYPFGFLASNMDRVIRYGETTGTTGQPTAAYMTENDWKLNLMYTQKSYSTMFSKEDIAVISIPYELAFSAMDIDRALSNIGVTVVATGALNQVCPWERTVKIMLEIKPTILVCTATRAIRFFDMLDERKIAIEDIGLKYIFYVGEAASRAKVRKIEKQLGVKLVTAYGSTETNTLSLPCRYGFQHLNEERYYFEVLDIKTGLPVKEGEMGELVVTSLQNEAMPLLRYKTGDLVVADRCQCGSETKIIYHNGRIGDLIHINGVSKSKVEMEELIFTSHIQGFYYNYFQDEDGTLIIEIESGPDNIGVEKQLEDTIQTVFGVTPKVYFVKKACFTNKIDTILKPGNVNTLKGGVR